MQFLGFGNGSDGDLSISSNTTDSPVDSSCLGTAGTKSLTATNASFTAGDIILIHQSRGTGVGSWELNQIDSYVAGTITTVLNLVNTYIDSGASQAQVLVVKQYSGIVIDLGYTLSAKAWNGNVGGILAYMCSGVVTVAGTMSARGGNGTAYSVEEARSGRGIGGGFRGGNAFNPTGTGNANQGEGTLGAGVYTQSPNGTGAGGGNSPGGGGGGGHATAGSSGGGGGGPGTGGGTSGAADLTTMTFGGGGGGGAKAYSYTVSGGGAGGGIILLHATTVKITGSITANGGSVAGTGTYGAAGGGGAGGSILIKTQTAVLGANKITATGGAGGSGERWGGAGGIGRIRIEACSFTGTTSPGASEVEGGQDWCGAVAQIMEG